MQYEEGRSKLACLLRVFVKCASPDRLVFYHDLPGRYNWGVQSKS